MNSPNRFAGPTTPIKGSVKAVLPLALLEAVRTHDRPSEILEDEDLTASLPRRLGLSVVVMKQLERYEADARSGRSVSMEEFVGLMRLVLKRPDAETILRDTGARYARHHFESVPDGWVKALRVLPKRLMNRALRKSTQRLARAMSGESSVDVSGKPIVIRITSSPLATLDPPGSGCALIAGSIDELVSLYIGHRIESSHTRCAASSGIFCEWTFDATR